MIDLTLVYYYKNGSSGSLSVMLTVNVYDFLFVITEISFNDIAGNNNMQLIPSLTVRLY